MGVIDAIQNGNLEAFQQALAANPASVHERDANGVPPLMLALYFRRPEFVARLIDAGAEIDFHVACALNRTEDAARLLAASPALLQSRTSDGWTALHLAAFFGAPETARFLLDHGADPLAVSANGMANLPLHAAAAARQSRIVEMLLDSGTPVDATQQGGHTALDSATQNQDEATIEVLRRHGANSAR